MAYQSVEQRMARNYINMFPDFVPDKNAPVSVTGQEEFYNLIKRLYNLAFDEPLLFVKELHEDDAFPGNGTKKAYGKPNLIITMKKFTKAVDALLEKMFLMGQGADVTLNKREKAVLSRLGDFMNIPAAWKWMSSGDGAGLTAFTHCLFDPAYPYTSDIYAKLLGWRPFKDLEGYLLSLGYERFDLGDVTANDCKLSLTIANPKWSGELPAGGFEYRIKHTGISAVYDPYAEHPALIGLCIPGGLKRFLEAFDSMNGELKEFASDQTKKCDACNYCIQTDKTGKRPRAYIPVMFEGKKYNLCTYFPGYYYRWTSLDGSLVRKLKNMLEFMDRFIPENKKISE